MAILKLLGKLFGGNTTMNMYKAAFYGDLSKVKLLLAKGAGVDAREPETRTTALMLSSFEGRSQMVQALLDSNADVNAKDNNGGTALSAAVWKDHVEVVRVLLANNAEVNQAALGLAESQGKMEVLRLLNQAGTKQG